MKQLPLFLVVAAIVAVAGGVSIAMFNRTLPELQSVEQNVPNARAPQPGLAVQKTGTNRQIELGESASLPLPSTMSVAEYEAKLFPFLQERRYIELGWKTDKSVRDTGPFIDGKYYGTHPAVRVFYSPGVVQWLMNGRVGSIPDGEMIIKEQYPPPAIRHEGADESQLRESLESWTVMVKDSAGSHDGWFWSNPGADPEVADNRAYPFDYPASGTGLYCVRCHASTKSPGVETLDRTNEFTFAALRNIEGFAGEPIIFRVDDSWRKEQAPEIEGKPSSDEKQPPNEKAEKNEPGGLARLLNYHDYSVSSHPKCTNPDRPEFCDTKPNAKFLSYFSSIEVKDRESVLKIPAITNDWVTQNAARSREFITSNQCMSCHAGLTKPYGPSMFVPIGETANYGDPGWHISPYGEWRWTPMGLAGRDPIFYAQLESEFARLKTEFNRKDSQKIAETLVETCMRCHGAAGKHQFNVDHPPETRTQGERFSIEHIYLPRDHAEAHYGALARDGVTCMVCHRAQPRPQPEGETRPYLLHYLETSITGNIHYGEKGKIFGPFKNEELAPYSMQHATAIKPEYNNYLSSSRMCGSCHTVSLPNVDHPILADGDKTEVHDELIAGETVEIFKKYHHHIEQATYLEWLNSEYQNEFDADNPKAQSCQDCHMSKDLLDPKNDIEIKELKTRIAAIQDSTYPDAENLAELKELKIKLREKGYRRHNFSGLNVFLIEMFNQHDDILGVRKVDFMTGSKLEIEHAVQNFIQTARQKTSDISVSTKVEDGLLVADVHVINKAGHRFPSGVGFRRAFLELTARDESTAKIVWSSGRTNELGVIVGADDHPLPEESFAKNEDGEQSYHPHHEVITSQDQAQVYETLLHNNKRLFTTSFIHGCYRVKDNRFLPRGWKSEGPAPDVLNGVYLEATHPGPTAAKDEQYTNGSGSDKIQYRMQLPDGVDPAKLVVEAKLYYQAIPPYYLQQLFEANPNGAAIKRLHFLCSNLDLSNSEIKDWKLLINSAEQKVAQ